MLPKLPCLGEQFAPLRCCNDMQSRHTMCVAKAVSEQCKAHAAP